MISKYLKLLIFILLIFFHFNRFVQNKDKRKIIKNCKKFYGFKVEYEFYLFSNHLIDETK